MIRTGLAVGCGNALQEVRVVATAAHLLATRTALPGFDITKVELFSLPGYILSGGFKPYNLLPLPLYSMLMALEHLTLPLWGNVAALRAVIVLEKCI